MFKTKVAVRRVEHLEIASLRIEAVVRYEEDDIPNNFPFRKGYVWDVTIQLNETGDGGTITGWQWHKDEHLYMKVCDQGTYTLLDPKGKELAKLENDYVPGCIGEYGEYLDLHITKDGTVTFHHEMDPQEWIPDEA